MSEHKLRDIRSRVIDCTFAMRRRRSASEIGVAASRNERIRSSSAAIVEPPMPRVIGVSLRS